MSLVNPLFCWYLSWGTNRSYGTNSKLTPSSANLSHSYANNSRDDKAAGRVQVLPRIPHATFSRGERAG